MVLCNDSSSSSSSSGTRQCFYHLNGFYNDGNGYDDDGSSGGGENVVVGDNNNSVIDNNDDDNVDVDERCKTTIFRRQKQLTTTTLDQCKVVNDVNHKNNHRDNHHYHHPHHLQLKCKKFSLRQHRKQQQQQQKSRKIFPITVERYLHDCLQHYRIQRHALLLPPSHHHYHPSVELFETTDSTSLLPKTLPPKRITMNHRTGKSTTHDRNGNGSMIAADPSQQHPSLRPPPPPPPPLSSPPRTVGLLVAKVIIELFIIFLIGLGLLLFYLFAKPYHRGYNCDDDSIRYPYKPYNTISSAAAACYSIFIPFGTILLNELVCVCAHRHYRVRHYPSQQQQPYAPPLSPPRRSMISQYIWQLYHQFVPFLFAATLSQFITDISKYTIGRLRPHFIDLCQPRNLQTGKILFRNSNCNSNTEVSPYAYVTDYVCTNVNANDAELRDAHLSFMSGHSSFSAVCLVYLVYYLQARFYLHCHQLEPLIRSLYQGLLLCLVFYTGMTRISDYKHHWSDVLIGFLQGTLVASLTAYFVSDMFRISSSSSSSSSSLPQPQSPLPPPIPPLPGGYVQPQSSQFPSSSSSSSASVMMRQQQQTKIDNNNIPLNHQKQQQRQQQSIATNGKNGHSHYNGVHQAPPPPPQPSSPSAAGAAILITRTNQTTNFVTV